MNLPPTMASEAAGELATGHPFAACYWDGPLGRTFSLRSDSTGLDVSLIARRYGGGGHACSRLSRGSWSADVIYVEMDRS